MAILTYEQQATIKPISANKKHVFTQLEAEICDLYMPKLLGHSLSQKVQAEPDDYLPLLDGSTFDYCGETINHKGLRYILAYYLYAEYVQISDFEDTFTGLVRQNRGETEHLSGGRIEKVRQHYIQIAESAWELTKKYIESSDLCEKIAQNRVTSPRFTTI